MPALNEKCYLPGLDDASDSIRTQLEIEADAERLVDSFLHSHPQPVHFKEERCHPRILPYPVVISQRRPGTKSRGFVRAYAPILEPYGINQEAFLDFLETFHAASQASKWISTVQISDLDASFGLKCIELGIARALQVAVTVAIQAQLKCSKNTLLDRYNNEFFRPRGLYCLVMAYHPKLAQDQDQLIITQMRAPSKQKQSNLPSGIAPLIFPKSKSPQFLEKQDKGSKHTVDGVSNYLDQRAQAKYIASAPHSLLTASHPPILSFRTRYLDPTHPTNSGGLLSFLTGGYLSPQNPKFQPRYESAILAREKVIKEQQVVQMAWLEKRLDARCCEEGKRAKYLNAYREAYRAQLKQCRRQLESVRGETRSKVESVLYLMVVNMPSEEELAAVRERLPLGVRLDVAQGRRSEDWLCCRRECGSRRWRWFDW